jgi:hypothetical protein
MALFCPQYKILNPDDILLDLDSRYIVRRKAIGSTIPNFTNGWD